MRVDEHTIELAGSPVFYRRAPAPDHGGAVPLYLHGIPTSSDDWTGALERTGGLTPDLPGFGRTGKGGQLDLSIHGHAAFVRALLDALGVERVQLVLHDWGAPAGLVFAQRHPDRVERIILVNALPLTADFRWAGLARVWRLPVLGELAMGSVNRRLLARYLRRGSCRDESWPGPRADAVWEQFDQGTQRAILRLYRDADPQTLAKAGQDLSALAMPALVLWGERDPWLPPTLGQAYAHTLGDATFEAVPDAGHWPWLDRPELLERIARFLAGQR